MLKDSVLKLYFYGKEERIKMIIGIEISERFSLKRLQSKIDEMTEEQQRDVEKFLDELVEEWKMEYFLIFAKVGFLLSVAYVIHRAGKVMYYKELLEIVKNSNKIELKNGEIYENNFDITVCLSQIEKTRFVMGKIEFYLKDVKNWGVKNEFNNRKRCWNWQ